MLHLSEDCETDILRPTNTQVLVENEIDKIATTLMKGDETEGKGEISNQ